MSKTQQIFSFTIMMCLICGLLLTAASLGLKDRQQANIKLDKQINILKALGLVNPNKEYLKEELIANYEENVKNLFLDENGDLTREFTNLPLYVVYQGDDISRYAVPFSALGLWSLIKGYLALDGNGEDVIGFTVYAHGETPGLGGEVSKPWFSEQFVGKRITNSDKVFVSIDYTKGGVSNKFDEEKAKNYIDVISGSTLTSKGLARDLKRDLEKYEIFSSKLRSN